MSREFKSWRVRFREKGKSEQMTQHLGHLSKEEVIKFFGLDDDAIEWYDVEELNYKSLY